MHPSLLRTLFCINLFSFSTLFSSQSLIIQKKLSMQLNELLTLEQKYDDLSIKKPSSLLENIENHYRLLHALNTAPANASIDQIVHDHEVHYPIFSPTLQARPPFSKYLLKKQNLIVLCSSMMCLFTLYHVFKNDTELRRTIFHIVNAFFEKFTNGVDSLKILLNLKADPTLTLLNEFKKTRSECLENALNLTSLYKDINVNKAINLKKLEESLEARNLLCKEIQKSKNKIFYQQGNGKSTLLMHDIDHLLETSELFSKGHNAVYDALAKLQNLNLGPLFADKFLDSFKYALYQKEDIIANKILLMRVLKLLQEQLSAGILMMTDYQKIAHRLIAYNTLLGASFLIDGATLIDGALPLAEQALFSLHVLRTLVPIGVFYGVVRLVKGLYSARRTSIHQSFRALVLKLRLCLVEGQAGKQPEEVLSGRTIFLCTQLEEKLPFALGNHPALETWKSSLKDLAGPLLPLAHKIQIVESLCSL